MASVLTDLPMRPGHQRAWNGHTRDVIVFLPGLTYRICWIAQILLGLFYHGDRPGGQVWHRSLTDLLPAAGHSAQERSHTGCHSIPSGTDHLDLLVIRWVAWIPTGYCSDIAWIVLPW